MDAFPSCQVCHEHFTLKGPIPYLLPCLHAVCETCVTSAAGGVIPCSTCQKEVNLTETHLEKDVVRQREIFHLTVQHRPSELLCTHEVDGNQAACWCQECEEFLCEYCQTLHEGFKATRKHDVQEIADIKPGSLDHEEYCSIHTKHPLDLWDKDCNCLICSRCRRGDHVEHDVVDVDEAADVTKAEFENHEKKVSQIGESHHSLHQTTLEQLRLADETSSTLKDKINHTFQSLKVLMDQRQKEITLALQQHTDQAKSQLDSNASVEQSGHLRCKLTTEYIKKALLYSSKYGLLTLKKLLGDTVQTCLHSAPAEEQETIPLPVFQTEELEKLTSTLSTFGEIVTLMELPSQGLLQQETVDYKAQLKTMEQEHKTQLEQMDSELEKSQATVTELQARVTELQARVTELQAKVSELQVKEADLQISERDATKKKNQTEVENITFKKTIKDLEMSVNSFKMAVKKHEQTLMELGLPCDITYHLLKTNILDKSSMLQCLHLKYDTEKVNLKYTHINDAGELVNQPDTRASGDSSGRFQNYQGTTSTVPLPLTDPPKYVEIVTNIDLDGPPEGRNLALETGICREVDRDVMRLLPLRQYCYSLYTVQCPTHNSVCTRVCKEDKVVLHLLDTFPNTAGSQTTLHHGIVYDTSRNRIVFLDVKQMKVIGALDNVDYTQPMWPMFGFFARSNARISMKLVVGNDIDMTPGKKTMILKAL